MITDYLVIGLYYNGNFQSSFTFFPNSASNNYSNLTQARIRLKLININDTFELASN